MSCHALTLFELANGRGGGSSSSASSDATSSSAGATVNYNVAFSEFVNALKIIRSIEDPLEEFYTDENFEPGNDFSFFGDRDGGDRSRFGSTLEEGCAGEDVRMGMGIAISESGVTEGGRETMSFRNGESEDSFRYSGDNDKDTKAVYGDYTQRIAESLGMQGEDIGTNPYYIIPS